MGRGGSSSAQDIERRRHERSPLLYSGSLHDGAGAIDCVIKDISASGARVMVEREVAAQAQFVLDIDGVGLFPSRIVWQTKNLAGIEFLSDPATVTSWISSARGKDAGSC